MSIDNALASVPVKNLPAAVAWYEQVLERPADSRPMAEVAEWRFPRGGWLQVYQLAERAGGGSFTIAVTDIEEIIARAKKTRPRHEPEVFKSQAKNTDDYRSGRQPHCVCSNARQNNGTVSMAI
jgi:hypothetical protein